jgi:hypothetical protein
MDQALSWPRYIAKLNEGLAHSRWKVAVNPMRLRLITFCGIHTVTDHIERNCRSNRSKKSTNGPPASAINRHEPAIDAMFAEHLLGTRFVADDQGHHGSTLAQQACDPAAKKAGCAQYNGVYIAV